MSRTPAALAAFSLIVLSACASGPRMSDAERLALLEAHAGEPVRSIRHPGRFAGWSAVGNSAMVLNVRPNEAYLFALTPCQDLTFAQAIRISNRGSMIAARFDSVTPVGPGVSSIRIRCHIQSIRPLDIAALRQTRDELREAQAVEREDEDAAPGAGAEDDTSG